LNKPLEAFQARCSRFFASLWPGEEKTLVFGFGKEENPELMLIGEAPGEQEVLEGKPFVGKAGKNLTAFLEGVDLKRGDIYISNTVKIRPTKISDKRRVVNRPPTREEISLFLPYLKEEIALVKPKMLVTLGNVALKALNGKDAVIGQCHGRVFDVAVDEKAGLKIPLFALYHPASVIYNRQLTQVYLDDLQTLKALIHIKE
jgi:uracil-DNA glycosylase, family 4